MLADIEAGLVGTVIVKDMSRLGRNYLQVGMYTEMILMWYKKVDTPFSRIGYIIKECFREGANILVGSITKGASCIIQI